MKLTELIGKEVIRKDGRDLGKIREADLIIEPDSGKIESIILHNTGLQEFIVIPCDTIKQVGTKVVVVDIE